MNHLGGLMPKPDLRSMFCFLILSEIPSLVGLIQLSVSILWLLFRFYKLISTCLIL